MSAETPKSSPKPETSTVEIPAHADVPRDLHEPYEWSNGWFPRHGATRLEDVSTGDGPVRTSDRRQTEQRVEMAAGHHEIPHPNIAARMKTLGGRSVAEVMNDAKYYLTDGIEYTEEQKAEELELIAGKPGESEGLPKFGGAIKEIDDLHDAIKNAPTPGWIKRFKAFFLESQQARPEFRMTKLQRDRKYLVKRAMTLLEIDPRVYEAPEDTVLATLIAAHQGGRQQSAEQKSDTE